MTYRYSLDDLLVVLHKRAPAETDAVALHRRRVEHGLLSVGLKLHCLDDGGQFSSLVEGLGGPYVVDINAYRNARASLCLVLPPLGSARAAIHLLECIEQFIGSPLFGNPQIQMQVCSPGRLSPRRAALLAIGFYLGSDTLRRYSLAELETTFARNWHHPRGKRLVLYDADGDFDGAFDWWTGSGDHRRVIPQLPMSDRSDLLTGRGSRFDIENINLIATLLTHIEYDGYWKELGLEFEKSMLALLDRHLLAGLVDAHWVRTDDQASSDDEEFFAALQELMTYAFEEAVRIREKGSLWRRNWRDIPARSSRGILQEVQLLLRKYRDELITEALRIDQGERR